MKRITVTLDDKTAAWARVYAARHDKSLSILLGELLHKTTHESREYDEAMQRYLAKKPVALNRSGAGYPTREALHERAGFR